MVVGLTFPFEPFNFSTKMFQLFEVQAANDANAEPGGRAKPVCNIMFSSHKTMFGHFCNSNGLTDGSRALTYVGRQTLLQHNVLSFICLILMPNAADFMECEYFYFYMS